MCLETTSAHWCVLAVWQEPAIKSHWLDTVTMSAQNQDLPSYWIRKKMRNDSRSQKHLILKRNTKLSRLILNSVKKVNALPKYSLKETIQNAVSLFAPTLLWAPLKKLNVSLKSLVSSTPILLPMDAPYRTLCAQTESLLVAEMTKP